MKKLMIGTGIAAMLIAGGVAVAAPGGGMARGPMGADANNDAILTRAEVNAQLEARFTKMDANGDGKITQEDHALRQKTRADERFKQMDADNNGQISRAEFDSAQNRRAEARKEFRGKMEQRGGGRGKRMHGKRGGEMRGMHRGMGGHMKGAMDANKDGAVTKQEFIAAGLARFDRMDANKDGQVTKEERQAARAAMRTERAQQPR